MLTRAEFYEMVANAIKDSDDFMRLFFCERIDPQNLDYNFERDVYWTAALEWEYDEYLQSHD